MANLPGPSRAAPAPPLVVALVTDAVYPWHRGGKETRTYHLATGLARRGFDVHVYTMKWWDGGPSVVEEGVRYHALCRAYPLYAGQRRSVLQAFVFALACIRLVGVRFDVLEADHMPHLQLFTIRLVAWLRRVPLLTAWHEFWGSAYWRDYLGPAGLLAAAVERVTVRLADHLVVISPGTAARLEEEGIPRARTTVVTPGIDLPAIDAAPAATDAFDVLFVGRLLSHKGVDLLFDALAACREAGLELTCAVVGNGPERERLEARRAELGLETAVRFLGTVDAAASVFGLMKTARVFVLPSVREGFGIVVAEALACGLPVVTTSHPDNYAQMLVEDGLTGWLCEPDADSLASALEKALSADPIHGAAARRAAAERADWQASVDRFGDLLEAWAERRPWPLRRSRDDVSA